LLFAWTTIFMCSNDRQMPLYPAFSIEMGYHKLFFAGLAWTHNPSDISLPCSWYNRHTPVSPAIDWDMVLWTFFASLASNCHTPISKSQV
jgi:hypothetical protein